MLYCDIDSHPREADTIIGPERSPHLQIDEGEPFPIESCRIERQLDRSLLTAVRRGGAAYEFSAGSRVRLLAGDSVLFVGRAVGPDEVLDLMSAETDAELDADEII